MSKPTDYSVDNTSRMGKEYFGLEYTDFPHAFSASHAQMIIYRYMIHIYISFNMCLKVIL
jgi:hypothetical protein